MTMQTLRSVEPCVDAIVDSVGPRILCGTPLGIGKPIPLLNALYRRARADPRIELQIFTALSLERPRAHSELERRLLEPISQRVFGDYPELEYERDRARGELPSNVRVLEFYLQAGKYLKNSAAQRDYISSNYTHVARDLLARGVNVVLQSVAAGVLDGRPMLSLSCNADIAPDLMRGLRARRAAGEPVVFAAQVNDQLPFMHGEALVEPSAFDYVVDDPTQYHRLFGPPKESVGDAESMIGLYASTLVKDGGELQVGIGALGDAVVYGLLLRQQRNADYQSALQQLEVLERAQQLTAAIGGTLPLEQGLFAASEMLVDGFMELFRAGILKRKVYDDVTLSKLLNAGRIDERVTPELLDLLHAHKAVHRVLTEADLAYLQHFGIVRRELRFEAGEMWAADGEHAIPDLADERARSLLHRHLGQNLLRGSVIQAGFFLGTQAFYQRLRDLPEADRELIDMRSVTRINQLYGNEEIDRLQRRHARFINTTMKVSLLGAASSDTLPDGNVVSGVGGQYNFVAMANELPDGRSLLLVRSTRHDGHGELRSNLAWSSEQATIPRHLRDIVITEYGCADLRGKTDEECVIALLAVSDARFQDALASEAKRAGKLRADYVIPARHRRNLPEQYTRPLAQLRAQGLFPRFPFGTDLTADELTLAGALRRLQSRLTQPVGALAAVARALAPRTPNATQRRLLDGLQLAEPRTLIEHVYRRLVLAELSRADA
jgi:acyl-CoA hydrolase